MKMRLLLYLSLAASLVVFAQSCQKIDPENPYDDLEGPPTETGEEGESLDPNTIQGIHQNVFLNTCANSGCHDGTFEPDFRSIESSYNTLVNHPAIKPGPGGKTIRVIPGDVENSMLWYRMHNELGGTEKMPIIATPEWTSNKSAYTQNIRNWIANGAKDQFGN